MRGRSAEKKGAQSLGRSRGGYTTKIHMIAGCPDHGMEFVLSAGQASDFTIGKKLIEEFQFPSTVEYLAMDKGYSGREMLKACWNKNIEPVVPPKSNMKKPWDYNHIIYLYRNEIERLFNRLKNFRRIATRYDKLDVVYSGFVMLGMIALLLKVLC